MTNTLYPCKDCLLVTVCKVTCPLVKYNSLKYTIERVVKDKKCCYCGGKIIFRRRLHDNLEIQLKCTVCQCNDLIKASIFKSYGGKMEEVILF